MSLRGLRKKEFPFTVVRYDEQRVGEQKGKGFSRARNAPSSSGFLVFCSSAGQIIPRKLTLTSSRQGEPPEKGDKGRLRIIATGSSLIKICLFESACPSSIGTVAAPCVLIVACALTIAAQC